MADVMVFSPSPQLTVTIEDDDQVHFHAGGQGVWQARMITSLDVDVVMVTALGGESGELLRPLIAREGIHLRAFITDAANGVYVHDRRGGSRDVIVESAGEPLGRHEQDELYGIALAEGLRARVCLLSGVTNPEIMPFDVYRRMAGDLKRNDCVVVADLAGDYLQAVVEGGLDVVKVSHEELEVDAGDVDALVERMRELHRRGAQNVIVSRAEQPGLVLLRERDGGVFEVDMPELEPVDPRGAGDSMTAGVAAVLAHGGDMATAVRTGAA
ncbi:PfkB family carbohydrate kinase, partial [Allorhizocola rhizosphaerae]|uniref:PfkB family carbohydrate kinase n=1 Tax=Allorhizocola rhizosphaerae TaxID=1872709 RepID=UPI000E3DF2D1